MNFDFDPFFGKDPFAAFFKRPKEKGAWDFLRDQATLPMPEHARLFYQFYEKEFRTAELRPQILAWLDHQDRDVYRPHVVDEAFSHLHAEMHALPKLIRRIWPKGVDAAMLLYDSWTWPEDIVAQMQHKFDQLLATRPFDAASVAIEVQKEHPAPKEYENRREMATFLAATRQGDFYYATAFRGEELVFHDPIEPRSVIAAMPSGIADTLRELVTEREVDDPTQRG